MAKKKSPESAAASIVPQGSYSADTPWWPSEFASLRFVTMQVVFLILLGIILYLGALTNTLLSFKVFAAWALNAYNPLHLDPGATSLDIAVLIWCFFLVLGNTLLHPSLGLITLAALRPWLDGYTFKTDNVYFLWGAVLIFVLWGVRTIFRNEPVRLPVLTLLSAGYLLVALVLSPWSINFGETYKQLLNWTGYVAVFVVTLQNLSNRRTQYVLLFAVLAGMAIQAIFAILQYHYVLPFLRHLINSDPTVLRQYFGVDHVTPEMQHRFNKNRAFGTVLFPNALAAFLILGIPASCALLLNFAGDFLPSWGLRAQFRAPEGASHRRSCIAAAAIVWAGAIALLFGALQFPASYVYDTPQWYHDLYFLLALSAVIALVPAGIYFRLALRHGFPLTNRGLLFVLGALTLLLLVWGLWLSYSRGGTLALVAGVAVSLVLAYLPPERIRVLARFAPRLVALLLCGAMAGMLFAGSQPPADAALDTTLPAMAQQAHLAQTTTGPVTRQGEDVTVRDLTNPESFSLRLSYWSVGLRIFASYWLTGVGLGNFKWAYPVYQQLGDGNVQEAHNSYLQAFTETGILGGLVIILFWLCLLSWLLSRIVEETDAQRRRVVIGLFGGLVAFLLHAAIDINFSHPTLMFFAMLFAGMAAAISAPETAPETSRLRLPVLAFLLIGATFAVGLSTRPYVQNLLLNRMQFIAGDTDETLMKRFEIAQYLMVGSPQARMNKKPPSPVTVRALQLFDIDLKRYVDESRVYEPAKDGSGKLVPAPGGTEITEASQLLFLKPWLIEQYMEEDALKWMQELQRADARFPYDPQLALHVSNWYQLLNYWAHANPPEDYVSMLSWSDEAIARNRLNSDVHLNKSRSLVSYWESNKENLDAMRDAIEERRKAAELAPAQSIFQYEYADGLRMLAEYHEAKGDTAAAAPLREQEQAARAHGWEIMRYGLPPKPQPGVPAAPAASKEAPNAAKN